MSGYVKLSVILLNRERVGYVQCFEINACNKQCLLPNSRSTGNSWEYV